MEARVNEYESERISLSEASKLSGVTESTLKRWVSDGVIPVRDGRWTRASAAQARVVSRMRERGYSLDAVKEAARGGRLAFGYAEDLFEVPEARYSVEQAAEQTGLEPELIQRLMTLLGTPMGMEGRLNEEDVRAMRHCSEVLASGFPLVAFLQLVRVYAQSIRRVADAEVRLFHLYVHEPLIQDGVPPLEMAEEMGDLAADLLPVSTPLMEYMHNRYLRFYIEQDVVGHMEADVGGGGKGLARVSMAFCFVDLTGFTRYTEEEGDEEALDMVERFVDTVEATLPAEAQLVKTIGDEVMVVSPDPVTLTEWAVGFLHLFQERPQPRVGLHYGAAVFRDGDYFGGDVNLAHRVVTRALGGEVLVTSSLAAEGLPRADPPPRRSGREQLVQGTPVRPRLAPGLSRPRLAPGLSRPLLLHVPGSELRGDRDPVPVGGLVRGAEDPGEPDLSKAAAEQVGAMGRAVHPRGDHAGRRAEPAGAPDEVLPDEPGARATHVAGRPDAIDEGGAAGRGVREEAVLDHVAGVPGGGPYELGIRSQGRDPGCAALLVDHAQHALLERDGAQLGGLGLGAGAARIGGRGARGERARRRDRERGEDRGAGGHAARIGPSTPRTISAPEAGPAF